jgi:IS605 OrfB family transposase
MRYAYKRLLNGEKRKSLKKDISKLFNINTRYSDDAIFLANSMISLCKERGQNPKKVIFGSRELFEQLSKNHLNGNRMEKLKTKWRESRQGNLYSRGDKAKQGNLNLRLERINDELYLRINTGIKQYTYAKVIRSVKKEKDKWIELVFMLEQAYQTDQWFPYSVRLKLKNGELYAFISIEEKLPPIRIKKDNGIIGIDINAYPFHIALAITDKDGNLKGYQNISLHQLLDTNSNKRQYLEWQIAHQIVEIAKKENKAISMENLEKLPKGKKGDGFAKLRRKLQKWVYKRLLNKIEITARRNGIEVRKVNPAYTSVIGKLKYAPQYNIDKDIAGAYVIARRGLGYKEKLPKNYKELLNDIEFLAYSIAKIEDNIANTKRKIKKETNQYKRNKLKSRLARLKRDLETIQKHLSHIQSGKSESATQQPVNLWKEQVRGRSMLLQKSWQVLSVALAFSCLEGFRDFSSLKRIILLGDWVGVASRLVPVPGTGTTVLPNTACRGWEYLKRRNINTPTQTVQTGLYSSV